MSAGPKRVVAMRRSGWKECRVRGLGRACRGMHVRSCKAWGIRLGPMESHTFNRVSRALAGTTSRRHVLRLVSGELDGGTKAAIGINAATSCRLAADCLFP